MYLSIHPDNPEPRKIKQVVDIINDGGVVIYPTDTLYALGCDLMNRDAINKIIRIKEIKPKEAHFSIICHDLSHIAEYTNSFNRSIFKLMKATLPGPYTFILNGNKNIPRLYGFNKNTIGIRVPDNNIARAIVEELGRPIIATSVHNDDDELIEFMADPWEINERYSNQVDLVIDGGPGNLIGSTIIDATGDEPLLIREGMGKIELEN